MMKISDTTFDVLKNFSTINQSLAFKKGSTIRTVSEQKTILAQAKVEETFPVDFAIYELNQFLGLSSLFEDADFDFDQSQVTLKEGSAKANYTYADPSMITTPPEKNIELPTTEVQFDMDKADLRQILNGANQLGLPEIIVTNRDNKVSLVATDTKNPSSNEFAISSGRDTDASFRFIFKIENLKFIQNDYTVSISKSGIAHFKSENVEYWVATEAGSEYN
nr:hypothetical protein 1 [Paracoccaceae bacterium]